MKQHDGSPDAEPAPVPTAKEWWERRRLWYNLALVAAGICACVVYVGVVVHYADVITPETGDPNANTLSLFELMTNVWAYSVMLTIANVCYLLGCWAEKRVRPLNVKRFRRITFSLGLVFSMALPFSMPAYLAYMAEYHPETWLQDSMSSPQAP